MKTLFMLSIFVILATTSFALLETIRPDGNGFYSQWQSSMDCSDYTCVRNPSTSDYVTTGVPFSLEVYTFENVPNILRVRSVRFNYLVRNAGSGSGCFAPLIHTAGKYHIGNYLCPGTSWAIMSRTYTRNPVTNLPWTKTNIIGLQAGMYSNGTTPFGILQVASVDAVVDYDETTN